MALTHTKQRPFELGTTGWTTSDLEDPEIERQWYDGRYEIVEGVLTKMAPAYFIGGRVIQRLIYRIVSQIGEDFGDFATEVDIVVADDRVARADAVLLTSAEKKQQREAALADGRQDPDRTRVLIPPTLIIECISPGHEQHDHRTKRRWYAEFGVSNYWLLDPFKKTLECLVLRDGNYQEDVAGEHEMEIQPALFPGLILRLEELWKA